LSLRHGKVRLTTELVDRVTRHSPSFPQGWYLKGELEKLRGEPEQALVSFDQAIRADPYYIIARNARSELLIGLDRLEPALEDVRFVQDIRPLDPRSIYLYALILARQGQDQEQVDAAMRRLRHALDRLGAVYILNHPPSLLLSGLAYFSEGNYAEADAVLTRYLKHDPADTTTRKLLGSILLRSGKPEQAIQMLEPAIRRRPDDPQLLALLGSAYLKLRETARATELLEQAAALAPDAKEIRTQLAMTRLAVGRREDAIDELESVLEVDPESAQAASTLGLIYLRQGEFEAALRWSERIRARDPEDVGAETLRGAALAGLERIPEARASFERVLALEPGNYSAAYNLAELDLAEGNVASAKARYEAIVHEDPTQARTVYEVANMERRLGNTEAAISWYEKLRAVAPDAVMNHIELLELYLQTRQPKRALAVARDLERRYPENLRVLLGLGRANLALNDRGHLALGCMDLDVAFVLPLDVVSKYLPNLHTTAKKDGSSHYWHLKIVEATSETYALQLPGTGGNLPLDEYVVLLESTA
jgi:putative PEP-CTERM system TPR-repeat lipoprotein